jgi:hypothetical protein
MVLDASNGAIAIMSETRVYSPGMVEIGEMCKSGISRLSVDIDAELGVVMNFGEDRDLILELKVTP